MLEDSHLVRRGEGPRPRSADPRSVTGGHDTILPKGGGTEVGLADPLPRVIVTGVVTIAVTKTAWDGPRVVRPIETLLRLQLRSRAISGDRLNELGRRAACS